MIYGREISGYNLASPDGLATRDVPSGPNWVDSFMDGEVIPL